MDKINNIEECLGSELLEIENPSRYFGPEFYIGKKEYKEGMLKCAMCFPDLYEIGMSNNAMKIIYNVLNNIDNVFCDRVFAVAPDFEKLLRQKNISLFTIQEHIALSSLDYLGFTMGCELGCTNILQVLDLGKIALENKDRKETDPVVIFGGPAATNPLPFSKFVDFVHIGEAEADSQDIVTILKKFKTRSERIEELKQIPYLWYPGKKMAKRAVDHTFGTSLENVVVNHAVIPSFQVAQDHGTVEIMRGCPNSCRFCHAGQYYKPYRQRSLSSVYNLVKQNVEVFGYKEVTLSSLSSGDYPNLDILMKSLNSSFKSRGVSFSLPSLKVNTFALGVLEQLSEVRKSGLTFAIETPDLNNQRSLNKEVPLNSIIEIISEAKRRGYRLAKFYFMTGLPFTEFQTEQDKIVNFLYEIYKATSINMNINIGTFIPKAHTPFQWAKQMSLEESVVHLKSIKKALIAKIPSIKVSYHEPSISYLEGIISRGNEECSNLIINAYLKGCRLDAWDEYLNFDNWKQAIEELNYVPKMEFDINENLPWDSVTMNVSKKYLLSELEKAKNSVLTSVCKPSCEHNCGVCSKTDCVKQADKVDFIIPQEKCSISNVKYEQAVFTYSKKGRAVYNSHISVMRQFEMAFFRSGLNIKFTEGFNPKPKMEFLNPISMGITGENELLLVEMPVSEINEISVAKLNSCLAEGFTVKCVKHIPMPESGAKVSLASLMQGSNYTICDISDTEVETCLKNAISDNNFTISSDNGIYHIDINGDKNIFKLLFKPEMNKFHIAGSSKITRTGIRINL